MYPHDECGWQTLDFEATIVTVNSGFQETGSTRRTRLWRPGDLDTPDEPDRWFERSAPLWLEIGFGNGDFLCDLATLRPDVNLVGIETSPTCHRKALSRTRQRGLTTIQLCQTTAEFVMRDVIPRRRVDRVYINFPSPWPKSSHADRRLLDEAFWTVLADRLSDERAWVQVTTDRSDYLDYALREATKAGHFEIDHLDPPDAVHHTKYARQARTGGRTIRTIRAHPTSRPAEPICPVVERVGGHPTPPPSLDHESGESNLRFERSTSPSRTGDDMHHAVLSGELPAISSFSKQVRQQADGDRTAVLIDCFEEVGDNALVFTGHTNEPDLEQQILIEVVDRTDLDDKPGDLMVRMRPFNRPLVTDATRMAVDMVVDYLVDDLAVAEVIDRKY